MPWVETPSGEKKKVACGPCIRGHRSTTCQHKDRVLLEVRKPGRPLSSCPHPPGKCSCERFVVNYTIPSNTTGCPCPSTEKGTAPVVDVTAFVAPPANASSGVKKPKQKKSASRNSAAIDKAIKAGDEGENQFQIQAAKPCCGSKKSAEAPRARSSVSAASSGLNSPSTETSPAGSRHSPASNASSPSIATKDDGIHHGGIVGAATPSRDLDRGQTDTPTVSSGPENVNPAVERGGGSCCHGKAQAPIPKSGYESSAPSDAIPGQPSSPPSNPQYGNQALPKQHTADVAAQYPANGHYAYGTGFPTYGFVPHMSANAVQTPYGLSGPLLPNHPLYPHYMPSNNAPFGPGSMHGQLVNGFPHQCTCGDACACLGCPVHPRNETTLNYVRDNAYYLANDPYSFDPPLDMQRIHLQSAYGVPGSRGSLPVLQNSSHIPFGRPSFDAGNSSYHSSGGSFPHNSDGRLAWPAGNFSTPSGTSTPATELSHSHQRPSSQIDPSRQESASTPQPSTPYNDENVYSPPMFVSSGDQTPTLSPSSYMWQQFELPASCSDADGTCQCGPGCTCDGCLTHNGIGSQRQMGMVGLDAADIGFVTNPSLPKSESELLNNPSPSAFHDVLHSPGPGSNSPVIKA